MKAAKRTNPLKLCAAVCLIGLFEIPALPAADQENYCFTCHTNPRKLIEITRGIKRTDPDKPGVSPETKGEG